MLVARNLKMLQNSRNNEIDASDDPSRRFSGPHSRPARPSSPLKFFASSSPTKAINRRESQKAWTANYLADLRSNRPARPSGSRPLVHRDTYPKPLPVSGPALRPSSALAFSRPSCSIQKNDQERPAAPDRCSSAMSHRRNHSEISASDDGKSLVRQPDAGSASRDFSNITISTTASMNPLPGTYIPYVERAQRRVEKQEARLLREALEEVDSRSEARLHAAAQDEASELVWKHRNPEESHKYCTDSHKSDQPFQQEGSTVHHISGYSPLKTTKEYPNGSSSERFVLNKRDSSSLQGGRVSSISSTSSGKDSSGEIPCANTKDHDMWDSPQKKAYTSLNFSVPQIKAFGHRKMSGPKSRKSSGGLFRNPDDKIYEEPGVVNDESHQAPVCGDGVPPLKLRARNSVARFQSASYGFLRSKSVAEVDEKKISRTEIHRNPPSQSRNPTYMQNTSTPDPAEKQAPSPNGLPAEGIRTKNGIEIRGEDIRAATSMRMKDRSPKLPSPTVVSDKPGRPIVSFDRDWKPKDPQVEENRSTTRDGARPLPDILRSASMLPESTNSAPAIPTISLPDPPSIKIHDSTTTSMDVSSTSSISFSAIPSISVNEPEIPSISFSDASEPTSVKHGPSRPSPFKRPLPYHSSTAPAHTSLPHWSPSTHSRPTAQCAACALPIAGRIVSAASQRFHPHCFTCFHCGELLECVAFYPEPTIHRENRLTRIEIRVSDPDAPDDIDGRTATDDGDSSLRFYCHLDFHELFSPRCRSCKTPIEGEVVLACGGEWHKGHFFCAQCGDPFDEKIPFVEKDGYAWCVGCHAGRFNGKCKGCKKVILEQGVQALAGEWHEGCFCCVVRIVFPKMCRVSNELMYMQECGGGFEDGRFFTRGDDEKPVCVGCEERRLKA